MSQLKREAEKQLERVEAVKSTLLNSSGTEFIPMLVTLREEGIAEWKGVFIVPIWKLNTFILEFGL